MEQLQLLLLVLFSAFCGFHTTFGSFFLRGLGSGKCLNIYQSGSANGAQLVIWDCMDYADNEFFNNFPVPKEYSTNGETYFQMRVKSSGKCVDVYSASTANGAKVDQWDCVPTATHEMFTFVPSKLHPGYFMIKAKHSGKCLNVNGGGSATGTQVVQWDCVDGTNDNWETTSCIVPYSSANTAAFDAYLKLLMKP